MAPRSSGSEPNGWRSWTASSSGMRRLAHTTAPAPMPPSAIIMKMPSSGVKTSLPSSVAYWNGATM